MLMNDKFNFAKVKVMKKGTHEWLLLSPPSNLGMVYRAEVGLVGVGGGKLPSITFMIRSPNNEDLYSI